MNAGDRRLVCVSLHDVAPATRDACARTLDFLDRLDVTPVALLVVPDYHGLGRVDRDARFVDFVAKRLRRGDEVVLHGFRHEDAAARPCSPSDWFERRLYTAGEGEFARLGVAAARSRILRGLAVLRAAGWDACGFVAPAWLMSPGTSEAVESLPLEYCATRNQVLPLRQGGPIAAPSLVVSARSPWRRLASLAWNRALLQRYRRAPVLRAALHPGDLEHRELRSLWQQFLLAAADREVVTEGRLFALRRHVEPGDGPRVSSRARAAATTCRRAPSRARRGGRAGS